MAYIRYRWGELSAQWILSTDGLRLEDPEILDCPDGDTWFEQQIGDSLDGAIDLTAACRVLGLTMRVSQD